MTDPARRMSALVLVGVCVALALAVAFNWFVLFPSGRLYAVARVTAHLIQPTLIATAVTGLLVALVSRPTVRDLGLDRGLVRGVLVLVLGYVVIQLGLVISTGGDLVRGRAVDAPLGMVVGGMIAQIFGTALVEETVFRGLLFRQLAMRMHVALAAALAAFIFAVWHIPQRQSLGLSGIDLVGSIAVVWLGGVFASWLYLRGGNLFVVIALHALFNDSAPLVASPISHQAVLAIYTLAILVWIERTQQASALQRADE